MSLAPGTRIGAYEILGPLGAGGMGEVYRARDMQLDRDVAIKILPELFAADPDRVMRFEREAKTLAALNHPHIAQIHGVEHSDGHRALVMELVGGKDLAERITRGPLPLDEALPVARQIAEALEAAHDAGIVHRDLKPANIRVRDDGTVKVLDFGLAKALDPTAMSAPPDAAHSPTITSPALTELGVILGTAAYMAPEQARGRAIDKRVDIWAFGCVLYQMLTGRSAFAGETVTDTLAAIMTRSPDLSLLPAGTPTSVRRLLERCLERDPKQRLRDIGEARIALAGDASIEAPAPVALRQRSPARALAWAAGTLAIAAATGLIVWQLRAPAAPAQRRFTIPIPANATPLAAAIAPDGSAVAFIADERLWLQRLDQFTPSEVDGARGARTVFWSPDSAFLGFQARGQLWKVAAGGGEPLAIGRVAQEFTRAGGAAWLDDGRIVFTTGGTGLLEIPVEGGTARPLLDIDSKTDADFHNVTALPGGRGVLFVRHPKAVDEGYTIEVYVPSDGTRRVLHTTQSSFQPVYSATGHILFQQAGAVWMLPFALDRLEVTGAVTRLQANALFPSVARDGTLVMLQGQGTGEWLSWVDRAGNLIEDLGQPGAPVVDARVSPDGRFAAATLGVATASEIWIFDVARGTQRQLTFGGGRNASPVWTPDSQHVVYICGTSLCALPADGSGTRIILIDGVVPVSSAAISPDGKRLVFVRESEGTGPDLWVVELGPGGPTAPVTAAPRPLVTAVRDQFNPAISPDGRFVVYVSSEVGQYGVYVSRFPEGGGKWVVSGYGAVPRWGARGDRLYFVGNSGLIVEMEVGLTSAFELGRVMSQIRVGGLAGNGFDVTADAQRFLVPRSPGGEDQAARLLVVQHWR